LARPERRPLGFRRLPRLRRQRPGSSAQPLMNRRRRFALAATLGLTWVFTDVLSIHVEASGAIGVDVSSWQGAAIDWHAVAATGVSFAYIRAGEGDSLVDGDFRLNWYRATGAGVVPGAYLFFHPSIDGRAQANLLI